MFNGAGGPFSEVPALKATGLFSVYRRTFQMEQMSRNPIPQDGDSEFAVTVWRTEGRRSQVVCFCEMCRTVGGLSVSPLRAAWHDMVAVAGGGLHIYRQCCNECI
jgi:hypothetical protein